MTSKQQGVLRPSICRFRLGEFEVTSILDGVAQRDNLHPLFGENETAEAVQALAQANRLPPDKFEHPFVPALVDTGSELILFDTGNGQARRGAGVGNLRPLLGEAGYSPEDVDIVVITHGHPDHIGGLLEDGEAAFPSARHVFGEREFKAWVENQNIPDARNENREMFMNVAAPFGNQATFVNPDDEVLPGIRAVNAYGHSPGLLAYMIESEGKNLLLWSDVTNHYGVSLQKPEWHAFHDDDKDMAVATRKRILDMATTDGLWVHGYHMPFPSVGFVEKSHDGYRWIPASYQLNL
jgi:glyoxylase-like metal-dependent hydrolase (beta-lactamase superfamily II)